MTNKRTLVESFNLDHRKVRAPYVRVADEKTLPHGDTLTKFDVRFCQPNVSQLDMRAVHSIEHLFAEKVRSRSTQVIDFSPMGCQTGFYFLIHGSLAYSDALDLIEATMRDILDASEVPAANEIQCGWAQNHSLEMAKDSVRTFLDQRASWSAVVE